MLCGSEEGQDSHDIRMLILNSAALIHDSPTTRTASSTSGEMRELVDNRSVLKIVCFSIEKVQRLDEIAGPLIV